MTETTTISKDIKTLDDVRDFLTMCQQAGVEEDAVPRARVKVSWDTKEGSYLTKLIASKES